MAPIGDIAAIRPRPDGSSRPTRKFDLLAHVQEPVIRCRHSMTSSVRASKVRGTVRPSALAVNNARRHESDRTHTGGNSCGYARHAVLNNEASPRRNNYPPRGEQKPSRAPAWVDRRDRRRRRSAQKAGTGRSAQESGAAGTCAHWRPRRTMLSSTSTSRIRFLCIGRGFFIATPEQYPSVSGRSGQHLDTALGGAVLSLRYADFGSSSRCKARNASRRIHSSSSVKHGS